MKRILMLCFCFVVIINLNAQTLMPKVADENVGDLIDKPVVVQLNDGTKTSGTLVNAFLSKGSLTTIAIKLNDGSKQKYKPDEIESIKVRLLKPIRISMVDSAGNPIREVIYTYTVFEHPFYGKNNQPKPTLMQVLNPGFDSKIKIFADPSGSEFKSISIKGNDLGAKDINSFIFVKNHDVIYVKEANYKSVFEKLFVDCSRLLNSVPEDARQFENMVTHIFLYDYHCKS